MAATLKVGQYLRMKLRAVPDGMSGVAEEDKKIHRGIYPHGEGRLTDKSIYCLKIYTGSVVFLDAKERLRLVLQFEVEIDPVRTNAPLRGWELILLMSKVE